MRLLKENLTPGWRHAALHSPCREGCPFRGLSITLAADFLPSSSVLCDFVDSNKGSLTKKSTEGCCGKLRLQEVPVLLESQAVRLNGYHMPPVIDVQMHSIFGRLLVPRAT